MLGSVLRDLRTSWLQLAVVDALYKVLAFLVLWPVMGLALRVFVELSGRDDLADDDIVAFLLGPIGWAACVVIGALWLAVVALEQAALMEVIARRARGDGGVMAAIGATAGRSRRILRLAWEIVWRLLALAAPFLAVGAVLFWWLLTEHDINFYLDTRPPVFWWAVGSIGSVLAVMAVLLAAKAVRWSFALPMILDGSPARDAMLWSEVTTRGRRWQIVGSLALWFVIITVLAAIAFWVVVQVGEYSVPRVSGRWALLMLVIGGIVSLWTVLQFAVSVVSNATFASLLLNLHRRESGQEANADSPAQLATTNTVRITWRRMLAGMLAAVVVSIGVGAASMVGVRLDDDTEVTAHRAGAAARPENTVVACEQAVRDGADWIEIDVQETSDGEVVVIHDRDLMKLGGSPLNVWESTAADLRVVDVGSSFDAKYSEVRLATLGEMLDAAKAGGIGVVIELKHYGHAQRLDERVAKIVEDRDMVDHIVIMSLDAASLKRMRELRPTWTIGRLTAVPVTDLTREQVEFLAVSTRMATPEFIRKAHARGKDVYVWTVNDAATMFEMTSRGADNLITDDPALARDVLEQRENMGPIDRLFVEIAERFGTLPAHIYHDAEL